MTAFGRRAFLAGAVTAAGVIAGCADDQSEGGRSGDGGGELPDSDLDALETIAQLEFVAREAYREAAQSSNSGGLGAMPAAGLEFLQSAASQHGDALKAVESLLRRNRRSSATEAHGEFEASVTPVLGEAKTWPAIAALARTIEQALSATALEMIHSTLQSSGVIELVGGLQATGQKRVAVLNFLLGEFPSPDAFQRTDAAIAP